MTRKINGYNATRLQVESAKHDVWSPDSLALSNGRHDITLSDLASISPMGINKSTDQTGFNRSTWTEVTGWNVRTGYPSTSLVGNAIEIQQKHRGIIRFNAWFAFQVFALLNIGIRLKINGQVVRTISHSRSAGAISYVGDFEYGDRVTVEIKYESKFQFLFFPVQYLTGTLLSGSYMTIEKYDRSAIDFQFDMTYDDSANFFFTENLSMVAPDYGKKQPDLYAVDVSGSNNTVSEETVFTWGPVLAQSRTPIPVDQGYVVDFSGKFRVRRFGIAQKDNPGSNFVIRLSLWGQGARSDEYGDQEVSQELLHYETAFGSQASAAYFDVTIPTNTPVVIPDNINRVYFTAVIKTASNDSLSPAQYKAVSGGVANNCYFGWYNSEPLKIIVTPPDDQITHEHPLSQTGVAFKNRKFFSNVSEPKNLVVMGAHDSSTQLLVYKYDLATSIRGSLIGTYSISEGERKVISVQSDTGAIELDSPNTTPASINRTKSGNQTIAGSWTDITGYTNGSDTITITENGLATISCVGVFSDSNSGKQIRFLVNGVVQSAWAASGATATGSYQMYLNAGDQVKMQAIRVLSSSVLATDTKIDITYVASKMDYYVESLTAETWDTLYETQTRLDRIEWSDITDDLNSITVLRQEFKSGKMTLRFVSDQLNNGTLAPGKRVRLVTLNYGDSETAEGLQDYLVVFTGTIRDFKVSYNYEGRPFVEVDIYDAFKTLEESEGYYYYDKPLEYANMLHGVGKQVVIDQLEVTGPYEDAPDGLQNLPSSYQSSAKIDETLEAVRNTNKGYVYVDRTDKIVYKSDLNSDSKLSVGDSYARSDISYGKIEKGTSTESIINMVKPEEHSLDAVAIAKRNVSNTVPFTLEDIPDKHQMAKYFYRQDSINIYGERSEVFPVVRGTGQLMDLRLAEYGSNFREWAIDILNDYDLHKNQVSRVMLVPNNFNQLKQISELEILDAVRIYYKNEEHTAFIRKIEWYVQNNHIRVEIYFQREKRQSAWLPSIESVDSYTNLWFETW